MPLASVPAFWPMQALSCPVPHKQADLERGGDFPAWNVQLGAGCWPSTSPLVSGWIPGCRTRGAGHR